MLEAMLHAADDKDWYFASHGCMHSFRNLAATFTSPNVFRGS